jgi:hypothetical protein
MPVQARFVEHQIRSKDVCPGGSTNLSEVKDHIFWIGCVRVEYTKYVSSSTASRKTANILTVFRLLIESTHEQGFNDLDLLELHDVATGISRSCVIIRHSRIPIQHLTRKPSDAGARQLITPVEPGKLRSDGQKTSPDQRREAQVQKAVSLIASCR